MSHHIPDQRHSSNAKWLDGLEFMANDHPGSWEQRDCHNHANPWQEERYW